MIDQHVLKAEDRMKKILEATRREFATLRSGKASPALLDAIRVDAYGQMVPLNQVGSVSAPEARLLVVQPWDKGLIKAVAKAIQQSELGLNPTDDGTLVRIPIPQLTGERRRDMVKLVSKLAEEGRVHMRQVRHDLNKEIKSEEHAHALSEDDAKRLTVEVQKLTDRYITQIDELLKKKTAEVMEV
ncbi:MAG: ribosome recycling factor [Candidatus Eisenbacteria bacterium]|uniref:Ribosome-recycling factor n=1 Tax=Eiseniibacteriota bacterium TaxID=2212470 RepID=A0A538U5D7_UNCEI|nr:MAG: ribosome recycling factor [Candidatus Eisenbacteria bacterium]